MTETQSTPDLTRDTRYYFDDGDLVIRVDSTLFKLHRFLLRQNSAVFRDMFFLARETKDPDGSDDEDPLVLQVDIEDFRAFCWVLYASRPEIAAQTLTSTMDIALLMRIGRITNKFQCASDEEWVTDSLLRYSQDGAQITQCSSATLRDMLIVADLCGYEELKLSIQDVWCERIQEEDLSIVEALNCAEQLGIRRFQGRLYYHQLWKMNQQPMQPLSYTTALVFSDLQFNEQRMRQLYTGYWSLTKYEDLILEAGAPPLPESSCPPNVHDTCVKGWRGVWKSALERAWKINHWGERQEKRNGLVIEKLQLMQTHIKRELGSHGASIPTENCRQNARQLASQMVNRLLDTLGDHFLGPREADT